MRICFLTCMCCYKEAGAEVGASGVPQQPKKKKKPKPKEKKPALQEGD
jgi:hypothetical protein